MKLHEKAFTLKIRTTAQISDEEFYNEAYQRMFHLELWLNGNGDTYLKTLRKNSELFRYYIDLDVKKENNNVRTRTRTGKK